MSTNLANEPTLTHEESPPESPAKDLILVSEILPDTLNILPFEPRPIFPNVLTPFTFSGDHYIELLKDAWENQNRMFGVALVKHENPESFFQSELYEVGTILKIYKVNVPAEGIVQVLAQGLQRFSCVRVKQKEPFQRWEVKYHYDAEIKPNDEQKAYALAITSAVKELLRLSPVMQESVKMMLSQMTYDNVVTLMDVVSSILGSDPEKLQDLLATFDLTRRSEKLLLLLKEELEVMKIQEKIQQQITEKVNKQQKDFFLREQLKAIKKELGMEKDDKTTEIEKFENRLKDLVLSEEADKVIHEELDKLGMMETHSPEYQVTRNYLDTLTGLPWGKYSKDNLNIGKARRILNSSHYGLDEVKKTILELISTIRKRGSLTGQILCLVGPPGVGKTSIGRSIAEALNREFFRFSLGGMRDEAEIKGHRRTYIGALPGKIIQAVKRAGTANPVIMLDEIDKLGASFRGDPASALLEVLDPEQNVDYLDHYLDVRFDLSKVLFITTANQLDTIPGPLLDRMEVIRLSGYILEEKLQIAKKYLIPRQREEHGIDEAEVQISEGALRRIIDRYAREAGVRNLENQLKKIMSAITLRMAEKKETQFKISSREVEKYLGKPRFTAEEVYPESVPGVTIGLAWTAMGGAILHIEAAALKAKGGGFKQTGQLGDVMKESTQIAYTCVRALLDHDKAHKNFFEQHQIHLHVPEGATPKDGPSAGITMALALYSLATGQAIPCRLGMTGELTLTGKVLPIGGLREKTIAAKRAEVYELIFPEANRRDYEELPAYIRKGLTIHFVKEFKQVLELAYGA
ncbi:endopeptidase La [bacterium (Candidatus Blackallbacteria) CG17_big_fil_post_rev_8_21_14_2_50_48_46]|uniref:Lon protease n=1 Tax=bacterium (Candidatus Blackallbacteria) CG17_big_fil_post_rev_8_21_14_2_50_48_46 TaxID=2014261 RepID=A0A2M7G2P6_9BACT|nr:MAG: endopeptidase La [bacterium (Candidatus Blackallbacteria) CG18_big_fil_WC_8_21_14_2_50_49_26]PIW15985.1 MAG: endopeptidase La [bacterium (Candidatus Blackallbacteria) CG17_big_fil_post_rev_8_21_14_2_50_48_46]PIW50397.1 MAG: endopeptidase La [bacterium (Candidatus Blackallbacteria) CG13_big_fil_rev_8_21_14_2_50_49_14]